MKPARTRAAPGQGADTSTAGGLRGAGAAAPPARWREALIPARPRRLDPACSAPPLLPAGCSSSLSSTITCDTSKREHTQCPGTATAAGLQGAGVRMPAAGTAQRAAHLILVVAPSPFAPRRAWTRNGFVVARREIHNRTHPLPLERVCGSLRWLRRWDGLSFDFSHPSLRLNAKASAGTSRLPRLFSRVRNLSAFLPGRKPVHFVQERAGRFGGGWEGRAIVPGGKTECSCCMTVASGLPNAVPG